MADKWFVDGLQVAGWVLTLLGQMQVARKRRAGFGMWIAANLVLIALCARTGLWWSIGMYATNIAVCAWSFRSWGPDQGRGMRLLFLNKRAAG